MKEGKKNTLDNVGKFRFKMCDCLVVPHTDCWGGSRGPRAGPAGSLHRWWSPPPPHPSLRRPSCPPDTSPHSYPTLHHTTEWSIKTKNIREKIRNEFINLTEFKQQLGCGVTMFLMWVLNPFYLFWCGSGHKVFTYRKNILNFKGNFLLKQKKFHTKYSF